MSFIHLIKFSYQLLFYPFIKHYEKSFQDGLSVLVCCKDEEHNIPLCLESIAHFADQVICVDNGSTDRTHEHMEAFKNKYEKSINIHVIKAPHDSLKNARNKGLSKVNRKWLLNSGGDFIYHTTGPHAFKDFFQSISTSRWSQGWRLGFINLYGDLHHTYKRLKIYSLGENYLVKMNKKLCFREEGKFDYLFLPKYYLHRTYDFPVFFHLDGLKSDNRMIYRNAYFEWRQLLNSASPGEAEALNNFDKFYTLWKLELFETNDSKQLKFRFQRQLASLYYQPYDEQKHGTYPEIIKNYISQEKERFKVVYKDQSPWLRKDEMDQEMNTYLPDKEDLNWNINDYDKRYYAKNYLGTIKQKMLNSDL